MTDRRAMNLEGKVNGTDLTAEISSQATMTLGSLKVFAPVGATAYLWRLSCECDNSNQVKLTVILVLSLWLIWIVRIQS